MTAHFTDSALPVIQSMQNKTELFEEKLFALCK